MARMADGAITFYNLDGDEIEKQPTQIEWDAEAAEKAGFEHFMIKKSTSSQRQFMTPSIQL